MLRTSRFVVKPILRAEISSGHQFSTIANAAEIKEVSELLAAIGAM